MNIIILEDSMQQQERIKKILFSIEEIDIERIFISARPNEVIDEVRTTSSGNVYLLDLEINADKRAGFKVAQSIRDVDPFGIIIFVTTHSNMAVITFEYQVAALDFIAKDLSDDVFASRIQSNIIIAKHQLQTLSTDFDYYVFENNYSKFKILFNDILYFETTSIAHKVRLVAKNKVIEFYADLKELENSDERLFKSHRSFVVNLVNIQEIDKKTKEIIFNNGETCLISRRLLKEVLIQLNMFKLEG